MLFVLITSTRSFASLMFFMKEKNEMFPIKAPDNTPTSSAVINETALSQISY